MARLFVVVLGAAMLMLVASSALGAPAPESPPIGDLMAEARSAMVAGDHARAISLYTLVLDAPGAQSGPYAQEALEYLGLAHQKLGQVAHAKAEYERYLKLYPDSEGAARVEQRLAALESARKAPPPQLDDRFRKVRQSYDVHGSLYTAYVRTEARADLSGAELVDSSQIADADLLARVRRGPLEITGRASGYFRYDFEAGAVDSPARVTRLALGARDQRLQLAGTVGRQSRRGAGILGRFDGVALDWGFMDQWTVRATAGFPLYTTISNGFDTSEQVYGLSFLSSGLVEGLNAELYGVYQRIEGTTDRIASGLELRYASQLGSAYGLIDVDWHFLDLNIATFSGNIDVGRRTTLNAVFDYRYSPILTTRNALIGQPVQTLDQLQEIYDDAEIEQLARDRTLRVTTLMAGATHRLTPALDVGGDFTATQLGGMTGSGGVFGSAASEWEFFYSAHMVVWDLLKQGGSERVGVRFSDGTFFDRYALRLSGQYPFWGRLRVRPAVAFSYRDNLETRDFIELEPGASLQYDIRHLLFELDFAFQWLQSIGSSGIQSSASDGLGYYLEVGLRYDF